MREDPSRVVRATPEEQQQLERREAIAKEVPSPVAGKDPIGSLTHCSGTGEGLRVNCKFDSLCLAKCKVCLTQVRKSDKEAGVRVDRAMAVLVVLLRSGVGACGHAASKLTDGDGHPVKACPLTEMAQLMDERTRIAAGGAT